MTNTHSELLGLAERVEGAMGPDRELDCLIAVAVHGFFEVEPKWQGGPVGYGYTDSDGTSVHPGHGGDQLVRRYTSSLDAAMTLAEGLGKFGGAPALLREAMDRLYTRAFPGRVDPTAYREALARFFTAACLRAHASLREGRGR